MNSETGLIVSSPLFLLITNQACTLCGKENQVAALATLNLDDPEDPEFSAYHDGDGFLLGYITELPVELLPLVLQRHPNYLRKFSVMADEEYLMSTCECGGHYGDHYVHRQILDEAFKEPEKLLVERLPIEGSLTIPCDYQASNSIAHLLHSQEK